MGEPEVVQSMSLRQSAGLAVAGRPTGFHVVVPPLLASRKAAGWPVALVPTAVMAQEVVDQQVTCPSWVREAPEPTPGTAALVHVSALPGDVIPPERMAGALALAPIR